MKTTEEVIYVDSGVTLNEQILYKRVELEKSITITESQFGEVCKKFDLYSQYDRIKKELGF